MEAVQAFIDDGNRNSEGFFIDEEDGPTPAEGCAVVSVGGIFYFEVQLEAPFAVHVKNKGNSKVLSRFESSVQSQHHNSVGEALAAATKAYTAVADELDEEMAQQVDGESEDGGQENSGDVLEQMNALAVEEAAENRRKKREEMAAVLEKIEAEYDIVGLDRPTVDRLLSDYEKVLKATPHGWSAKPDGRNLCYWLVEFSGFDEGSELAKDMAKVAEREGGRPVIELSMKFPSDYPFRAPFVRIHNPRFVQGSGYIFGGAICSQLLADGWNPVYDIEAILESIRQQITDPSAGARVDHSNTTPYTPEEARSNFAMISSYHKEHGWH